MQLQWEYSYVVKAIGVKIARKVIKA